MAVRFLTDAMREQLSGFPAELDSEALDRFFTFSDADLLRLAAATKMGTGSAGRCNCLDYACWGSAPPT